MKKLKEAIANFNEQEANMSAIEKLNSKFNKDLLAMSVVWSNKITKAAKGDKQALQRIKKVNTKVSGVLSEVALFTSFRR